MLFNIIIYYWGTFSTLRKEENVDKVNNCNKD